MSQLWRTDEPHRQQLLTHYRELRDAGLERELRRNLLAQLQQWEHGWPPDAEKLLPVEQSVGLSAACYCSDYQSSGLPCPAGRCPNNSQRKGRS